VSKDKIYRTLQIKKRLVAITSVLLALTLMTTISFSVALPAFAEGGKDIAVAQEDSAKAEKDTKKDTKEETKEDKKEDTKEEKKDTKEDKKEDAKDDKKDTKEDNKEDKKEETKEDAKEADGEDKKADPENPDPELAEPEETVDPSEIEDDVSTDIDFSKVSFMPEVSSTSYIVMSGSTSEVVIEHHAQRKMSPGRITMLMTAMVVLDNMYNDSELNNTVEITDKIAKYGDSFKVGESVTVGDLLKSMLVGGSEEAAEALSRYSASKRKVFINMMNSKAMELGLLDTQFDNPTGAYSTKQYSTASDCAKIAQAAIRYQKIQELFELPSVEFEVTSKDANRALGFRSTNPLLVSARPSEQYKYTKGGILGTVGKPVKGSQYAGIATVDDMQLIVILLDSKEEKVAYEAKGLLAYGDTKVTKNVIVEAGEKVGSARVRGAAQTIVPVYTANKGFVYVPPEGSEDLISTEVYVKSDLEAPLTDGDKVGEYRIYVADELKGTVDLVIKKNVTKGWFPSRYYISNRMTIAICIVLGIIVLLVARILYVRWRKKKMREERRQRKLQEIAQQQFEIDEDRKRRNWTYTSSYDQVAPRTGDLRKEAAEEESGKTGSGKQRRQTRATRATWAERRKAAKAAKTGTVSGAEPSDSNKATGVNEMVTRATVNEPTETGADNPEE